MSEKFGQTGKAAFKETNVTNTSILLHSFIAFCIIYLIFLVHNIVVFITEMIVIKEVYVLVAAYHRLSCNTYHKHYNGKSHPSQES